MKINVNHVRREECPSCGANAVYPYLQDWNTPKAAVLCGRDTVQVRSESLKRIPKQELIKRLKTIGKSRLMRFCCIFFTRISELSFSMTDGHWCMEQMM